MDGEDKKKTEVNTAVGAAGKKRPLQIGLALIGAVVLVVAAVYLNGVMQHRLKISRSNKLIGTIKTLEDGKHNCNEGIAQLKSVSTRLAGTSYYTDAAREKALYYLMPCEFMQSNQKQATIYANQLGQVLDHEGLKKNSPKQLELTAFKDYMKAYFGGVGQQQHE